MTKRKRDKKTYNDFQNTTQKTMINKKHYTENNDLQKTVHRKQ